MSNKHGSLSEQSRKRHLGGELILNDLDDDDTAQILTVHESSVRRWRKILCENPNKTTTVAKATDWKDTVTPLHSDSSLPRPTVFRLVGFWHERPLLEKRKI